MKQQSPLLRYCHSQRRNARLLLILGLAILSSLLLVRADVATTAASTGVTKSWTLYHTVYNDHLQEEYLPRARIQLKVNDHQSAAGTSTETANAAVEVTMTAVSYDAAATDSSDPTAVCQLTQQQVQSLLRAGWYQLKLVPDDAPEKGATVVSTVPACLLRRANFRDEINLTFGPDGQVLSLAYMPIVSPLAPKSCNDDYPTETDSFTFDSKVSFETAATGMTLHTILPAQRPPPGLIFHRVAAGGGGGSRTTPPNLDGSEPMDENAPEAPPVDNTPFAFLRRYWYIILPILLMNFMAPEPPAPPKEDQQQQQQQPPPPSAGGIGQRIDAGGAASAVAGSAPRQTVPARASGGSPAATAQPATTAGGNVSNKQRRGKRG